MTHQWVSQVTAKYLYKAPDVVTLKYKMARARLYVVLYFFFLKTAINKFRSYTGVVLETIFLTKVCQAKCFKLHIYWISKSYTTIFFKEIFHASTFIQKCVKIHLQIPGPIILIFFLLYFTIAVLNTYKATACIFIHVISQNHKNEMTDNDSCISDILRTT